MKNIDVSMKELHNIVKKYFKHLKEDACRCEAEHYYCLECLVCRAEQDSSPNTDKEKSLASYIDHTNLKPEATSKDILSLCDEAVENGFYSVCVNPFFVELCSQRLHQSKVKICSVNGFPLGANFSITKLSEAFKCIDAGADEIDTVINISALKDRKIDMLFEEVLSLAYLCHEENALLKCIIETCLLTEEEKIIASLIVKKSGADFVKTSTGYSKSGADLEDIMLLRRVVGNNIGIKASGGIRTRKQMLQMIEAGADRIGTSSGVQIVSLQNNT